MKKIKDLYDFLTYGIWRIKLIDLPKKRQLLIAQLRTISLSIRGFKDDNCVLRASSLTFFSLLSIVPVFAMAFGVAKSFNLQEMLENQLRSAFEGMKGNEEVLARILEFSKNQLQHTQGGVVAGIGVIFLFWAILKLLGNVEWAFNEIWGIKVPRPLTRKIADYLIIVVVTPIFLVIAGGITAFLAARSGAMIDKYEFLQVLGPIFIGLMKFLPLIILIPFFTFLYIFMPNTRISIKSGLISGLFTALCFMGIQMLYFEVQVTLFSKYSAIYGSFAAIPLFLIWLEISWMIVLFGAELSFAVENIETNEFETESKHATLNFRRKVALCITNIVLEAFDSEKPPPTTDDIRKELGIPLLLANATLFELVNANILRRVTNKASERENAYLPALPEHKLTVHSVLDRLASAGLTELPFTENPKYDKIDSVLQDFKKRCESSKSNIVLNKL